MKSSLILTTIALIVLVSAAQADEKKVEVPFHMPIPDGWRTETIPFPLSFAPELTYSGLEELRFAPGMFDESKPDYWSYAFIWWVPANTELTRDRLRRDLAAYFRGLTEAVAESREFDPGDVVHEVLFDAPHNGVLTGTVKTYDAFAARAPVVLNVRITMRPCRLQGMTAAFFELSPQPMDHEIWRKLEAIRTGVRCTK